MKEGAGAADWVLMRSAFSTSAPIGRYNKLAAILYADLHNDAQSPGALLDMRKWIDRADSVTWGHRSSMPYPPEF